MPVRCVFGLKLLYWKFVSFSKARSGNALKAPNRRAALHAVVVRLKQCMQPALDTDAVFSFSVLTRRYSKIDPLPILNSKAAV